MLGAGLGAGRAQAGVLGAQAGVEALGWLAWGAR